MTETLSRKDYLLLSAYLDGELSPSQMQAVQKRLLTEPYFKRNSEELAYTRQLLRSMPKIRAPHNFTLSSAQVKKTAKRQIFQPVWGLVSAVSTFILLVIFAGTSLLPRVGVSQSAAPEMAPVANDAAMTQKASGEPAETPMIILWNPQRAYGMGGGGGGDGIGGAGGSGLPGATTIMESPEAPPPDTLSVPANPTSTPESFAAESLRQADPSTIILGIPEEATRGSYINSSEMPRVSLFQKYPPSTLLMTALGIVALVSAALAIFLRRR